MDDRLIAFAYTAEEEAAIALARAEAKPWNSGSVADVKARLKALHFVIQNERCCYCRRSLHDEFQMVIDVEHVLPKSAYGGLMFEARNLSVSCKRCNMQIKKENVTFLVNVPILSENYWHSDQYRIVHPNLDLYSNHLRRSSFELDEASIVVYVVRNASAKGDYTKKFFHLGDLEISSFDAAQRQPGNEASATLEAFQSLVNKLEENPTG